MFIQHGQIDTTQIKTLCLADLSYDDFFRLYFLEITLLLALVAITIFRREMSCNHCYSENDAIETAESVSSTGSHGSTNNSLPRRRIGNGEISMILDWNDEQAESILEGTIEFYSGSSLLFPFLSKIIRAPIGALFFYLPKLFYLWWKSSEALSMEDILDGAENYYSWRFLFSPSHTKRQPPSSIVIRQPSRLSTCSESTISDNEYLGKNDTIFTNLLPADATVHILTFLHPKDIVAGFGCVSKACHEFINDDPLDVMLDEHALFSTPSRRLWKKVFERDYEWMIECWSIGRQAKQRSFRSDENLTIVYTKDFYFRFGLSYMNYILAGQNSSECCLVGIGGHIYNLTGFLSSHPGTPETVLVHAGRDATTDFTRMRHTNRALRLAEHLCIIVDMSLVPASTPKPQHVGTRPTKHISYFDKDDGAVGKLPHHVDAVAPLTSLRSPKTAMKSLARIRSDFQKEHVKAYADACYQFGSESLEDVNVYYDPFLQRWKAWFIDSSSLENVFVDCDCW